MRHHTGYRYRLVWRKDRELSELQEHFKRWLTKPAEVFSLRWMSCFVPMKLGKSDSARDASH
jgi:hypothetical protein